uniref:DUF1640 domain-containing protein n=1 Tax=Candidatus Kentrum eta TaxID=2126337 RepID=A0A450UKZ4_9GAMM|nr:MAG: hypothetical protein BECKH772A_GA0070896_100417 [Candidatus Kentron sp. H]VFJ93203.1 MAG: hypothetical protein BECKH772B_GA0070898_100407 [Candidatus Kentron sp. H]VFK00049.1 MAG: hypothetical protein BECKH772C_GA0070978_100397 [Candidatus Kentron sp. H]
MTVMVTELYQALKESGASEESAARAAQALVSEERFKDRIGELATKADLAELSAATKADLAELRASTKADLTEMRATNKADLAELKADLTRTILIAMVAITGVFAAIVKVL